MKVEIFAVGRFKADAQRALFDRYIKPAGRTGKGLGLAFDLHEVAESRARNPAVRKDDEARALLAAIPAGARLVALDEHGRSLDSRAFAEKIAGWRDAGVRSLAFAIGGPDGLGEAILSRADLSLAFGAMTWPHQLVRIMLAEQLYRAVTILSGHPYHRE